MEESEAEARATVRFETPPGKPRLWLARPDAQTPSRDRPWIERRPISCSLEPVA
jgi:hypothetical protein